MHCITQLHVYKTRRKQRLEQLDVTAPLLHPTPPTTMASIGKTPPPPLYILVYIYTLFHTHTHARQSQHAHTRTHTRCRVCKISVGRLEGLPAIRDVGCAHSGFAPYLACIRSPKVRCVHPSELPFWLRALVPKKTLACIRFRNDPCMHPFSESLKPNIWIRTSETLGFTNFGFYQSPPHPGFYVFIIHILQETTRLSVCACQVQGSILRNFGRFVAYLCRVVSLRR